jgi:hypothetical protein
MPGLDNPTIVMPPVYELPINMWRWCILTDVCAVVSNAARMVSNDFSPTPEELVHRFASLARLNKIPEHLQGTEQEPAPIKFFRFSLDGRGLRATEVPLFIKGVREVEPPPFGPFELEIGTPYPDPLFVPEGWVIDTLKAIRCGAIAAAEFHEHQMKVGYAPKGKGGLIHLAGKEGDILAKIPDWLR